MEYATTPTDKITMSNAIVEAAANPWAYLGLSAGAISEATKLAYQSIAAAIKLAEDTSAGLLSRAAQQQRAAEIFKNLADSLANQAGGLRDRLSSSGKAIFDRAIH